MIVVGCVKEQTNVFETRAHYNNYIESLIVVMCIHSCTSQNDRP